MNIDSSSEFRVVTRPSIVFSGIDDSFVSLTSNMLRRMFFKNVCHSLLLVIFAPNVNSASKNNHFCG